MTLWLPQVYPFWICDVTAWFRNFKLKIILYFPGSLLGRTKMGDIICPLSITIDSITCFSKNCQSLSQWFVVQLLKILVLGVTIKICVQILVHSRIQVHSRKHCNINGSEVIVFHSSKWSFSCPALKGRSGPIILLILAVRQLVLRVLLDPV